MSKFQSYISTQKTTYGQILCKSNLKRNAYWNGRSRKEVTRITGYAMLKNLLRSTLGRKSVGVMNQVVNGNWAEYWLEQERMLLTNLKTTEEDQDIQR